MVVLWFELMCTAALSWLPRYSIHAWNTQTLNWYYSLRTLTQLNMEYSGTSQSTLARWIQNLSVCPSLRGCRYSACYHSCMNLKIKEWIDCILYKVSHIQEVLYWSYFLYGYIYRHNAEERPVLLLAWSLNQTLGIR